MGLAPVLSCLSIMSGAHILPACILLTFIAAVHGRYGFEECHNSMMEGCVCGDQSKKCATYVAAGKCDTDEYARYVCEASCGLCEIGGQSSDCSCRPAAAKYSSWTECGAFDDSPQEVKDFYALGDTYSHSPSDR